MKPSVIRKIKIGKDVLPINLSALYIVLRVSKDIPTGKMSSSTSGAITAAPMWSISIVTRAIILSVFPEILRKSANLSISLSSVMSDCDRNVFELFSGNFVVFE